MYKVRVDGDGTSIGEGTTNCTTPTCFYIHPVQVPTTTTSYTICVASIYEDRGVCSESCVTTSGKWIFFMASNLTST